MTSIGRPSPNLSIGSWDRRRSGLVMRCGVQSVTLAVLVCMAAVCPGHVSADWRKEMLPNFTPSHGKPPRNVPPAHVNKNGFRIPGLGLLEPNNITWRSSETVDLNDWLDGLAGPRPWSPPQLDQWKNMTIEDRAENFRKCIRTQGQRFVDETFKSKKPILSQVRERVVQEKEKQGKKIVLALFYGRFRYANILHHYLLRNLKSQGGIVDYIHIVKYINERPEQAEAVLQHMIDVADEDEIVVTPFCERKFGCAYHQILNDKDAIYIKLDDDLLFIKDGSFEHIALQKLVNPEFLIYMGSTVNHPHSGRALHTAIGANPGATEHHARYWRPTEPPFVTPDEFLFLYYGPGGPYTATGSRQHESFIWRASHGQLDVYDFGLWDMNECRCAWPQVHMEYCSDEGYYRWNINAFAYTNADVSDLGFYVKSFDEPSISIHVPQHTFSRTAVVGQALFVHGMFTRQRTSHPNFALEENVLLPWYKELAVQYTSQPWDSWKGNATLHDWYRDLIITPTAR